MSVIVQWSILDAYYNATIGMLKLHRKTWANSINRNANEKLKIAGVFI